MRNPVESLERRTYFAISFAEPVTYSVGRFATTVHVGDFNGDAKLDLMVGTGEEDGNGGMNFLAGNGDGTFQPAVVVATGFNLLLSAPDLNNDGKVDLLVADLRQSGPIIQSLLGNGDGTFGTPISTGVPSGKTAVGDFNDDGTPDIATTTRTAALHYAFGNGDGTFSVQEDFALPDQATDVSVAPDGTAQLILVHTLSDRFTFTVDGKKFIDLDTAAKSDPIWYYLRILIKLRNPTITAVPSPDDLDQALYQSADPVRNDVFTGSPSGGNSFFASGQGGGMYDDDEEAGSLGTTATIGGLGGILTDFTGSGLGDGVVFSGTDGVVNLLPRQNAGNFGAPVTLSNGGHPADVNASQFTNDTATDLVVLDNVANVVRVFLNTTPQQHGGGGGGGGTGTKTATPTLTATLPAAVVGGAKAIGTKVSVSVANTGTADLNDPVTVTLYVSTDDTLDAGDTQVSTITKTLKIKPGASKALKLKVANYPSVADGVYKLLVKTSATGLADATATSGSSVTIAAPFVDLSGSFATPFPTAAVRGRKLSVPLLIQNAGNIPAAGTINVAIASSLTTEAPLGAPSITVPVKLKLKAASSKVVRLKLTVPDALTPDSYFLIATIDSTNVLAETDETNNVAVSGTSIIIS